MLKDSMTWKEIVDKTYEDAKQFISNEKDFKEWMILKENIGRPFDPVLVASCYNTKKKLQRDDDKVFVIVGREGSGKSTLAAQICSYVDPSFDIEGVCFSEVEFIDRLIAAKKGQAVSVDEGGLSLLSREAMTQGNRNMIKIFMTIRLKCLGVVICVPSYADLDRYIRDHRVSLLIQITERGKYKAIYGAGLNKVNREIGKMKSISAISLPDGYFWHGYFTKDLPVNIGFDKYLAKKNKHVNDSLVLMRREAIEREQVRTIEPKMIPASIVARELSLTPENLSKRIRRGSFPAKKIGKKWFVSKEDRSHMVG